MLIVQIKQSHITAYIFTVHEHKVNSITLLLIKRPISISKY